MSKYYYPQERVAIVGMGGIFPDADDMQKFWTNILANKVSIRELPDSFINSAIYYRPEYFGQINKHDKTYTIMGSMVNYEAVKAIGKKYKIPPAVAEHMDQNQHAAIYCVDQALQSLKAKALPIESTAVILGNGNPGAQYERAVERVFYATVEEHLRANPLLLEKLDSSELERLLQDISTQVLNESLPITEDSAPGILQNLVAGRIANVFGFQGASFMTDAACASSLAAIASGVQGLLRNEYDAVIAGGIDLGLQPMYFAAFSAINAISPHGSFPFDARANGFIIGSGGGVVVLKRLEDALRDKDNIIALISGYGQGSDGKGKYIAAPNEDGQARVIQQACHMADYSVDTIELMEAHGTGTTVGDSVETNALKKAFAALGAKRENYCGLGSVKSNIGHLKAAAGAPGIIKASLALYNKILPPTASIQQINPKLKLEGSPFYILAEKKGWPEHSDYPRRANVSAFGFGGADFHITMEEFRSEFYRKIHPSITINERTMSSLSSEPVEKSRSEVVLFSGESIESLNASYLGFQEKSNTKSYTQHVFTHNNRVSAKQRLRLAICATSYTDLAKKWAVFEEFIKDGRTEDITALAINGIYYGEGSVLTSKEIAMIFPGQASQYPNMCQELPQVFPVVRSLYAQVDALWEARYGYSISSLVFGSDEALIEQELKNTKNTHPAMFLSCAGVFKLFSESGVKADYLVGHSLGEMIALYAGDVLDLPSAIQMIGARGNSFDVIPKERRGKMMSIKAGREDVERLIKELNMDIHLANINAPEQTVVGGSDAEIDRLAKTLSDRKVIHTVLNVSHAFHTQLIADAAEEFYRKTTDLCFSPPRVKIIANHLQEYYPESKTGLKNMPQILKEQIVSSVRFVDSIQKLYDEGVRVFLEVGPSTVLTNLVRQILPDKDIKTIATCPRRKDAAESYCQALGQLFSLGIQVRTVPSQSVLNSSFSVVAREAVIECGCEHMVNVGNAQLLQSESLVYSGASIGLPGTFKKVFDDRNFDYLCEGHNFIEMLTDEDLNRMLDLNITRLVKNEEASTFRRLSSVNELIRLASKLGELDMLEDYLVDDRTLTQMTSSICAGVAAGYEAIKDAGIPLVQEWVTTSSGSKIPGRLILPEEMRNDTGIIFANCFVMVEPFVQEVSRYVASRYGSKTKQELISFYDSLILRIDDPETKKLLTDWFAQNYSRLSPNSGEEEVYEFNNDFITQYTSLANNRLAQFIGASGPNFHLTAACSSTAYAVTVAESLIRTGQAARVIVVGAENPTSKATIPWFGGSFLTSGAATTSANLYEAAVPFDNRRNGMILGAGAVGLVIERERDVKARGMNGICRLMGTHSFNMAGHQSRIDSKKFSAELERFISRMEREYSIDRNSIASKTLYFSHETYTPKRGGCSQTEKSAIQSVFGDRYREILVTNTKGMTGHTIGASIEEAVAAKSLQYQKAPPIVNYKEPDPELEGLKLSHGGSHSCEYALRMIAGFGGQGNYILMQKIASGDERICDSSKHQSWLERITDSRNNRLELKGRILVALDNESEKARKVASTISPSIDKTHHDIVDITSSGAFVKTDSRINGSLIEQVLDIYSSVTKYPKDMLEMEMEMEADLGIDTVKQATIFAMLAEKFRLEGVSQVQLSNYPTIGHIIDLISSQMGAEESISENKVEAAAAISNLAYQEIYEPGEMGNDQEITDYVLKIISEVTKYPVDMLELDMEMEADLGIDTVKQATIISYIAEKYSLNQGEGPQITSLPTIRDIINLVRKNVNSISHEAKIRVESLEVESKTTHLKNTPPVLVEQGLASQKRSNLPTAPVKSTSAEQIVLEIISEVTKYPTEMLELEMEMEADLGIDTVKQATIFSILSERFGLSNDRDVNISEYKTIGAVVDFLRNLESEISSHEEITQPITNPIELDPSKPPIIIQEQAQGALCYQVPVPVDVPLPPKTFSIKEKNIWVVGNCMEVVNKVATYVKKDAKSVETIVFSHSIDTDGLTAKVKELSGQEIDVLIDCGDLGRPINTIELSSEEERDILAQNGEARFIFYKALQENCELNMRVACIVSLDGMMGYAGPTSKARLANPYSGVLSGFYKGLRKEWKSSSVKIVDLNVSTLKEINREILAKIIDEIETDGDDFEIGYYGKARKVIKIRDLDKAELTRVELPEEPHILITGGANGITAEIAMGLANHIKGKYTLLGRTVLPENIAQLSAMDETRLEQMRAEIHNKYKAMGQKVTPLMVQQEFEKITKAIYAYKVIHAIEQSGSKVSYFPCDVRETESIKTIIDQAVTEFGPIHGLIHGAGIEKSHLLMDKSLDEFRAVFSVKAEGICNLARMLDFTQLKVIVGFSSISGRFGNEAQLDYCSANNFLGSYIQMLKQSHPNLHTLTIDWSGWKDVGMAWRNDFVRNHGEEMGVHLIEPARGIQALIRLFTHGMNHPEVIISKGLKGFIGSQQILSQLATTPLIDWVTLEHGKIEKAYKVISVKTDPIFDHHRLGTTPLVPAVGMMEIFAEYHRLHFGRKDHYCFRDLSVTNPIKLFHDKSQEVFVDLLSEFNDGNLEVVLNSYFTPKIGEPKLITHCQASVSDKLGNLNEMLKYNRMLEEEFTEISCGEAFNNSKWQFNNNIKLGPLFIDEYGYANNKVAYNNNGLIYSYILPQEQLVNKAYQLEHSLVNPCLMDTLFQAAAIHALTQHDRIHLPLSAEEIGVIRVPREIESLKIIAHLNSYNGEDGSYDIIMIDSQGEICYYMKNVKVRRINM